MFKKSFSNSLRLPQQVFILPKAWPLCRNPVFNGTRISWAATPAVDIVPYSGESSDLGSPRGFKLSFPQGSGAPRRPPAHVRPGWLSATGSGARTSRRRLAALSPSLSLCSLAGVPVLSHARSRSHSARLAFPASLSAAAAAAADAFI